MKIKNWALFSCGFAVLIMLASCATGPKFQEYSSQLPSVQPNKARLFIYRPGSKASSEIPDIKIDGNIIGQLPAKGFLVLDTRSGAHTLKTSFDARRSSTFFIKKGETNYLRVDVKRALTVNEINTTMVESSIGIVEIDKTTYSGK